MQLLPEERLMMETLGLRLKEARIRSRQTQDELGARIGVSRQTLARMEKGDPTVSIGNWITASSILGLLDTWQGILKEPENPFEEYDRKRQHLERLKKARVRLGNNR